ncbi:unnamed protein product [Didymodactylos carnosus]|uniref:Uncharacterized protein n=1 Tax=Didymodactylos carnosus TaxID=1234261 RepID=A0A814YJF0_9BILA|nr:unnamed protein product [Didymodactylos carnosus]CAF1432892.1 unnamed protein product [Didymodactylos carnosus]CAF3992549.1 unnamed protein product [Didymodactylos carnosus]CAF4230747.1 unnamed protein product [Didymodactylos carnosus]
MDKEVVPVYLLDRNKSDSTTTIDDMAEFLEFMSEDRDLDSSLNMPLGVPDPILTSLKTNEILSNADNERSRTPEETEPPTPPRSHYTACVLWEASEEACGRFDRNKKCVSFGTLERNDVGRYMMSIGAVGAPEDGKKLLSLAKVHDDNQDSDNNTGQIMNNEMVMNLKKMYDCYVNNNMSFVEQVRIIAILPRSYDQVMKAFNCSRYNVKIARKMQEMNDYMLNNEKLPVIRQRIKPEQTKHFIAWLVESNTLVSDSLSTGELILKQFKENRPHITKLYRRTDNASNFSSHSTPEGERVICEKLGINLVCRDYSEVQKGKDICDRICGSSKSRLRAWSSNGNDIQNAVDIKEGMEYAGGIKDTKIAVAQISEEGVLGTFSIPNVSFVRSIMYDEHGMKVQKASGIGEGKHVPYKGIDFANNMRITILLSAKIDSRSSVT